MSRDWVQTLVVNPLGEEAAAVRSAGHVLTRHNKVAAAILVAAEQDLDADIAEVWSALVRQTVRTGLDVQMDRRWFSNIIHAGPRLQHALPHQFKREQRRKEIAVAAAKSAVQHQSTWLGCITDLAKTYRNSGDLVTAVRVNRETLCRPCKVRSTILKESEAIGMIGALPKARLEMTARIALPTRGSKDCQLADHLKPAPITAERTKLSCAGLASPSESWLNLGRLSVRARSASRRVSWPAHKP